MNLENNLVLTRLLNLLRRIYGEEYKTADVPLYHEFITWVIFASIDTHSH